MNWDSEENWLELHHRLVIHAYKRCHSLGWRKFDLQNLPGGHSPETIANEAVTRWLDGTRVWEQEPYPGENPLEFLKGVVNSIVSDLVRGIEHRCEVAFEDECQTVTSEGAYRREFDAQDSTLFNPPVSSPEDYVFFREILRRIQLFLSDDADLTTWYAYSCDGMKVGEIANAMGISPQKGYILRRRFLRRIKDILDEWLGGNDAPRNDDDIDENDNLDEGERDER